MPILQPNWCAEILLDLPHHASTVEICSVSPYSLANAARGSLHWLLLKLLKLPLGLRIFPIAEPAPTHIVELIERQCAADPVASLTASLLLFA
jgi:hypothetical protein